MSIANCPECEAQNGDACSGSERTCLARRNSALDAGIPASVLDGKTTLRDHFSDQYIAYMLGRSFTGLEFLDDEQQEGNK